MRPILLAFYLLLASDALAQDSLRRVTSEPITVSGVASPVDSLPISISTRKIEPTQTLSSNSLEQAVRAVPGLQIDNRNNYALGDRITMRGIGARSFFGTRGIRVIKDDIPLTFADGQTNLEIIEPSQLASVQVLRGPASSIFGNASGGTLILKSMIPPSPADLVKVSATLGSDGYQRFAGAVGSRSGDLNYGAYVTLDTTQGYRDWSGMQALHFGTQTLYTIGNDALRLNFDNVSFSAQNPGALSQKLLDSNRRMAYAPNVAKNTGKDGSQSQVGLTYLTTLGAGDLTTSAYGIFRNITNPTPQQIVDLDRNLFGLRSTWEVQLPNRKLDSATGLRKWLRPRDAFFAVFLDAQYQLDDRKEHANDSGHAGALQTDQNENIAAVGIGVNLGETVFDALKIFAGFRYDLTRFQATDNFVTSSNPDQSGSVAMSNPSTSFGISYEWLNDQSIFLSGSQSFETPTSTELANKPDGSGGYNTGLRPQKNHSAELGFKGEFLSGLRYNLLGFDGHVSDALIPFQVEGQEGRDFYRNAGTIDNTGVEFELNAQPVESLSLDLAYSYTHSRFENYRTSTDSLDGKLQPGVHPHLGSATLTWRTPIDLDITGSVRFASKVAVNDANTAFAPEYTVVDLQAKYSVSVLVGADRELTFTPYLHVNNLFDRKYIGSYAINAFGGRYYEPAPERSIFAGIQVGL